MKLYKVLDSEGNSCHGGTLKWSLPKGGKPGEWHKVNGVIVKCRNGIHLTTDPVRWPHSTMRIFLAEAGDVTAPDSDAKVVTGKCRLVRELTDTECAKLRVFRSGSHEVTDVTCIASGSSTVRAYGSSTVRASGSSTVTAYDSSTVVCHYGQPKVDLQNKALFADHRTHEVTKA